MENVAKSQTTDKTGNPKTTDPKAGCLQGAAIIALLIFLLIGVIALTMYLRPSVFLRYAILSSVENLQGKLEREKTLPKSQYEELGIYLRSMKKYAEENEITRSVLLRIRPVNEAFKAALLDGQITREELLMIRAAVWRSNLPLELPPRPVRTNTAVALGVNNGVNTLTQTKNNAKPVSKTKSKNKSKKQPK